ncbi:MAG: peptidase M20 [Candidatus Rokuibacteriota bacterium]|nr:MAG: peptidase M20 [Candidatus Rokubacteria bacterium]
MIDRTRLVAEFLELVRIDSLSKREGRIAKRLGETLTGLGAAVEEDDAGQKVGGEAGNLLAKLPGTAPGAPALLLCAHMDTVVPGENVKPVVSGDVIRTDGTTVLGGDDKSGLVAILETLRVLREDRIPHGPIDVLFTICEEYGLLGAKHFDAGRLRARTGLVLDVDGACELVVRAPAANKMVFTVHGLEAHAGVCPEQGISAIKVAGEAIAAMRLGRIDAETTANLGLIEGGLAVNIVPNRVRLRGEARSLSLEKLEAQTDHMRRCFEEAAARHRTRVGERLHTARAETRVERDYDRLDLPVDAPIVRLTERAAANLGKPFTTRATGGGSDANVLNGRGLQVANLACGMREIHTVNEWIDVKDMVATTELLLETVRLHMGA